tara:strand:- start:5775 stop:6668 length:894 start_codon:yes stop_codon:yes gene_type:complete
MVFNIKYFLKNMVRNPIEGYKEFIEDIQKDNRYRDFKNDNKKLWICGLPKSGTTLIEQILDFLPYLRIDRSLLRNFPDKDKLSINNFSNYTKCFSNENFSYVKTHLEFDKKLVDHLESDNFLIVVSFRDIRDAMISRYYHILNDKNHWQHELVKNENFETGFIYSLKKKYSKHQNNNLSEEPLVYYYNWILNWKKIDNSKILKLWFEDYKDEPLNYIKKILNFTNFNNYNEKNIYDLIKIKNKKDSSTALNKKLNRINKNISTFRSGKTGEWKELFTKKINHEFLKIIPDDLSKILK